MLGFTDEALVLFPSPDNIVGRHSTYQTRLSRTFKNIMTYCRTNGITPNILWSDEVALKLNGNQATVLRTLTRGDEIFMSQNNDTYASLIDLVQGDSRYADLISDVAKKFPLEKSSNIDERFTVVCKRESKVSKAIIDEFRLVFNVQFKNHKQYKAQTKDSDRRIVVSIDALTFLATAELSGKVMPIIELLEHNGGNLPVYDWRF